MDQERILDSTGALALSVLPDDLLVVGGGYIGVELGTAYARLGSRVTIVEVADRILGEFDDDVVKVVATALDRIGVSVHTGTAVASVDGDEVHLDRGGVAETVKASHVLVSVGRVPNTDDLQLEDAGLSAGPARTHRSRPAAANGEPGDLRDR